MITLGPFCPCNTYTNTQHWVLLEKSKTANGNTIWRTAKKTGQLKSGQIYHQSSRSEAFPSYFSSSEKAASPQQYQTKLLQVTETFCNILWFIQFINRRCPNESHVLLLQNRASYSPEIINCQFRHFSLLTEMEQGVHEGALLQSQPQKQTMLRKNNCVHYCSEDCCCCCQ